MGFLCPDCNQAGSLLIGPCIDLGADTRSDEICVQLVGCTHCTFRGTAVYEESRRGALDSECVDHYGYRLPAAELDALWAMIGGCPHPRDAACVCPAHRLLKQCDPSGRWNALAPRGVTGSFPMRQQPGP